MKKLLSWFLVLCITVSMVNITVFAESADTSGTCGDNLQWQFDADTGNLTISGYGDMTEFLDRSQIPWYSIRKNITELSFSDELTSIGMYAFYECSNLKQVVIPEGVETIGSSAFQGCSSLTSVIIPDSVTWCGWDIFTGCDNLKTVGPVGGDYDIQVAWTDEVPEGAFDCWSGITSITIPDGIVTLQDYIFNGCISLTEVIFPDSVTTLGKYAFSQCNALTEIEIPGTVSSIGQYAFHKCPNLKNVVLGDGVKTIGNYCFTGATSLEKIAIPNSVTYIGTSAFNNCTSLTNVYYGGSETQWAEIDISSGNDYLTNANISYNENGHVIHFTTLVSANEATCQNTGNSAYYICSGCDEWFEDADAAKIIENHDSVMIPVTDHSYEAVVTEPTCTEQGYTTYTCKVCQDTYVADYTEAKGHSYEATVTEPTCTEQGCTTYTCKICQDTYVAGYTEAKGHSYEAVVTEPTCTEQGYTTYTCKNCGASYVDTYIEGKHTAVLIPAVEATCQSTGNKAYYICSDCGEWFEDAEATEIIEDHDSVIVSQTAHNWDEGVITQKATKTKTGIMTYTCQVCGTTRTKSLEQISDVTIYALDDWADEFISIPEDCLTSYQIPTGGADNVTCYVYSGDSVEVTKDGYVTPSISTWYWYGNIGYSSPQVGVEYDSVTNDINYGVSTVRVCTGSTTYDVTIEVCNYADVYADQVMDAYIAENIAGGQSIAEQMEIICKFPAGYDYSPYYSSAAGMIISGGGDCWASTSAILKLCDKLGYEASTRNGNRDYGSGSGHINALVIIGEGDYYVLEAGYTGEAPRYYDITHKTTLYSYRSSGDGIEVYQYDGDLSDTTRLVVPDTIDGKSVTAIGDYFVQSESSLKEVVLPDTVTSIGNAAFRSCTGLETLHIPASVTEIGSFVFSKCTSLANLTCAEDNPAFSATEGVLYNKKCTSLIYAPGCSKLVIPNTVTEVSAYACYHNYSLTEVTMPESVKTLGEGAFGDCDNLSLVKMEGIEDIGDFAFCNCSSLKWINIPKTVTNIGDYALGCTSYGSVYDDFIISGVTGSAAETYAEEYEIQFVDAAVSQWVTTKYGTQYFKNGFPVTGKNQIEGKSYIFTEDGYLLDLEIPELASVSNTSKGVTVKWKKVEGASKYRVFRKTGSGGWKKVGDTTSTSYTDTTVKSGTTYTYTVRCLSSDGTTYISSYDKTGKSIKYIAQPVLSSVSNASTGVTVKWAKVTGAAKYRVFRKTGSGSWKKVGDTPSTSYTDTTAKSGTTYTYTVRCTTSDGKTYTSSYDTTGKSIKYLSRPKLSSASNTSSGVTVKWGKVTGASGYYVYRKTSSGSYSKIATIKSGSTVSYSDTAVKSKNGTKYIYTVRAYSGKTLSSYESGKTIVRLTGSSISSLKNSAAKKMTVKWAQNSKVTGYQVQYSTSSKFSSATTKTISGYKNVSKTITGLTKGKTYYVRVRGYKTVSGVKYYSVWSAVKSVKISK